MERERIVRNKTTKELGFLKTRLNDSTSIVLFLNGKLITVQSEELEPVDLNSVSSYVFNNSKFNFVDLIGKSSGCEDCLKFILSLKNLYDNGGKI